MQKNEIEEFEIKVLELARELAVDCCFKPEEPYPCLTCRYNALRVIKLGYSKPKPAEVKLNEVEEMRMDRGSEFDEQPNAGELLPLPKNMELLQLFNPILEELFPKNDSKERGEAMVLMSRIVLEIEKFGTRPLPTQKECNHIFSYQGSGMVKCLRCDTWGVWDSQSLPTQKELDVEVMAKHIEYWWGSPNFNLKEYLCKFKAPELELPNKKEYLFSGDYTQGRNDGYNQCLSDIKEINENRNII